MDLPRLTQDPREPDFVQNPYPFYARARALGPVFYWPEMKMAATVDFALGERIFKHPAFGRAAPAGHARSMPDHLAAFERIERHSMLEHDPPEHTRLRRQVLQSFTTRRIAQMAPTIQRVATELIDAFPRGEPIDLLTQYAEPLPVGVIAAMLNVPNEMAPELLRWSHDIVAMYQSRRTRALEDTAARSSAEFHAFITQEMADRRTNPGDDLLSDLVNAPEPLEDDAIVSTAILLLNAGHEATVHAIGNALVLIHYCGLKRAAAGNGIRALSEEALRFDPPLHIFTRWVKEPVELLGAAFEPGDQIAVILGGANRDPNRWARPDRFDPERPLKSNLSLGAGEHFCLGASLARLEMDIALQTLCLRCPNLRLTERPHYADRYHFHGLVRILADL